MTSSALPFGIGGIAPSEVGSFLGVDSLVKAANALDATQAVRDGLPVSSLRALRKAGFTIDEIARVTGTSPRTVMRHLRQRVKRLDIPTSDRVMRMARVSLLATRFVGDAEKALTWLRAPNYYLGEATPIDMMQTEDGTQAVVQSLVSIAYGGVA
jgi:putative toxin-antitoxin system antitoxin component (TIGR02293 family)